jgi:hypothetical protein
MPDLVNSVSPIDVERLYRPIITIGRVEEEVVRIDPSDKIKGPF